MIRKSFVFLIVLTVASVAWASTPTDLAVQAALNKDLAKFSAVTSKVEDNVATLTGTVARFTDKQKAERKAKSYGAVKRVVNLVTVDGTRVANAELLEKLSRSLAYDRSLQGNVFNWFDLEVENGRVTVSGYARTPWDKDSALALVAATTGVRDLADRVEVLPLSSFDDRIRIAAARRIYGSTNRLNALDPAHPIRIIVKNGTVTLKGVVHSQVDKALATARLAGILGVFAVENQLQVSRS
jgi:osmotically-inducible protein OsmY